MICDRCHAKEATVYYTEIVNGRKTEEHLCRDCAEKANLFSRSLHTWDPWTNRFGMESLFRHIMGGETESDTSCPQCGETYENLRSKGLLKCPQSYEAFRGRLRGLLDHIHGGHVHKGKHPAVRGPEKREDPKLLHLKETLQARIAEENYEEAARLRDEIQHFSEKGGSDQS